MGAVQRVLGQTAEPFVLGMVRHLAVHPATLRNDRGVGLLQGRKTTILFRDVSLFVSEQDETPYNANNPALIKPVDVLLHTDRARALRRLSAGDARFCGAYQRNSAGAAS